MITGSDRPPGKPRPRPLNVQLHRSKNVVHASILLGFLVLITGLRGGIGIAGGLFLVVLFAPIYLAYRRDRLSFPLIFATLFVLTWPWAMYKAAERVVPAA